MTGNGKDGDRPLNIAFIGTGASVMRALGGNRPTEIRKPVTAPPDVEGEHGRAWRCDLDALRRRLYLQADGDSTLAAWLVEAPWAHPAWHSYAIVVIHLRPLPNQMPLTLYLEGATHEIIVYALAPDGDRAAAIAGRVSLGGLFLSPANFGAQFIEIEDEPALDRVQRAVEAICAGQLSPDTDFRHQWIELFGGNMMKERPE